MAAKYNGSGGKNLCVKRRNVGDNMGPATASNVFIIDFSKNLGIYEDWVGSRSAVCVKNAYSPKQCTSNTSLSSYPGCSRTVCTYLAANSSCQNWKEGNTKAGDWRLPTYSELSGWAKALNNDYKTPSINKSMGNNGLDICTGGHGDGSGRTVPDAGLQQCTQTMFLLHNETEAAGKDMKYYFDLEFENLWGQGGHNIWRQAGYGNNVEYSYGAYKYTPGGEMKGVDTINFFSDDQKKWNLYSARCVAEKVSVSNYTSSSGGGGGGGARLNIAIPDSYIPKGAVVNMSVGTCSAGAGGGSCVSQISTSTGYIAQAYGGNAGGAGTASSGGAGGAGSSTCKKHQGGWSNISCSAVGKNGTAGSITSAASAYIAHSGGIGGNGADNSAVGKGGNGGSTNASGGTTSASSGAAGYARFYYDKYETAMLSGGGGGSGAVLTNITIPQSILDSNIGGKIEIKSGSGGAGGSARNNGAAGTESYVVVKNSSGNIVWGYKALGGKGGGAASTSAGGTGGAGGTCQFWNGSSWANTACSSNGIQGGNGAKSTDGSTPVAGAGKGSGYSASGAGSNNISTTASSGSSSGIAKITYDRHFQAAAGGGGGGGAYAQIKGIKVIPLKTYNIRIGKGGNAGSIGNKGQDGGMSYIDFEGTRHYASGGGGGNPGTSQTAVLPVTHGIGGTYGKITTSTTGITFKNGTSGSNGISQGFNSSGGNGGTSGINTKGACGGMFINASICQNGSIHGQVLSFKLPRNINKTPTLGVAGAGGGGGGWNFSNYTRTGSGSKGLDGYVYIWWQTFK